MKKASFIISFLFINAIAFAQDSADLQQQSAANKFGSTGDIIFFILFGAFLLSIILFAKPAKDGMFLGSVYLGLKGSNSAAENIVWGSPGHGRMSGFTGVKNDAGFGSLGYGAAGHW